MIEASLRDRRWQLVLDCLDAQPAPFAKGPLLAFRLIKANLDRRLVERTLQSAETTRGLGTKALPAALDCSPRWGAGRVKDTDHWMGHALPRPWV